MTEIHSFSLTLLPERVKVCIGFPAQKRDCYLLIILRSSRLRRLGAFLRLPGAGEEAMGVKAEGDTRLLGVSVSVTVQMPVVKCINNS